MQMADQEAAQQYERGEALGVALGMSTYAPPREKARTGTTTSRRTTSSGGTIFNDTDSTRARLAADFTNVTADSPE